MSEKKFNAIRAKYVALYEKREEMVAAIVRRYGSGYSQSWLTTAEQKKLDAIRERMYNVEDSFFALLDQISPRQWRSGIASRWIMWELTYADATTRAALSAIPAASYGSSDLDVRRIAAAI